mgnify:CR=1 FL=1
MVNRKVLVILAHPDISGSRVNRALKDAIAGLREVSIHELYKEYPDREIDVKKEQGLLLKADAVVFQFPFYWYSSPALLKEWQDKVLEYGFAYDSNGTALRGKEFLVAVSTGGPKEAYAETGLNRFGMVELLRPYEAMANLTGMRYNAPFVINGVRTISDEELKRRGGSTKASWLPSAAA